MEAIIVEPIETVCLMQKCTRQQSMPNWRIIIIIIEASFHLFGGFKSSAFLLNYISSNAFSTFAIHHAFPHYFI